MIAWLIPDVPEAVQQEIKKEEVACAGGDPQEQGGGGGGHRGQRGVGALRKWAGQPNYIRLE